MNNTYPLEKEITPLLLITTLLSLGWYASANLPSGSDWTLFGYGHSKFLVAWLIPLAGILFYTGSLSLALIPAPVAAQLRRARTFHIGRSLTLWVLLGLYVTLCISLLSSPMPVTFIVSVALGLLLFFVSAISNG